MWFCKISLILVSLNLIKSAPVDDVNKPKKIDIKVNIKNAYITIPINEKYLENLLTSVLLKSYMEASQENLEQKPGNMDWNAEIPVSFNLSPETEVKKTEEKNTEETENGFDGTSFEFSSNVEESAKNSTTTSTTEKPFLVAEMANKIL